jgi:hypothetical protein
MLGVVQHEIYPPRAARQQEALQGGDARRFVEAQRGGVGIKNA